MGERKRIGIVYLYDKSWLGGVYYIQNLLIALNTLNDDKKFAIDLYCLNDDSFNDLKLSTNYPYLEKRIIKISVFRKAWRKLLSFISKSASLNVNFFEVNPKDIILYPYSEGSYVEKLLYWKMDFQEKYLPEFFSEKRIQMRDRGLRNVCKRGIPIVFSSKDSQNDFFKFYPEYKDNKTFVVHFAVHQPDFSYIDIVELQKKYQITKPYFFCANQFWQHKNHLRLFKAFKKVLDSGKNMQLVCTGNLSDYRNSNYPDEIRSFISSNSLENDILILGMIPKDELLCLMKNSYAVVQPSLFEGWNTTVEDCKAMSKFVFLSDLSVHREQIDKNVCFFNPTNEIDMAEKLLMIEPYETKFDYSNNITSFADDFYKIVETIERSN